MFASCLQLNTTSHSFNKAVRSYNLVFTYPCQARSLDFRSQPGRYWRLTLSPWTRRRRHLVPQQVADGFQEAGGFGILGGSASDGVAEDQLVPGPGRPHVEEPPGFPHEALISGGNVSRQDMVAGPNGPDDGPLQTLGGGNGAEGQSPPGEKWMVVLQCEEIGVNTCVQGVEKLEKFSPFSPRCGLGSTQERTESTESRPDAEGYVFGVSSVLGFPTPGPLRGGPLPASRDHPPGWTSPASCGPDDPKH